MLSKGSELFVFEGDLFKLKQKWINQKMDDEKWHQIMEEGNSLLKNYDLDNEMISYYCFQEFATFIDFLDQREMGVFKNGVRKGLLEVRS